MLRITLSALGLSLAGVAAAQTAEPAAPAQAATPPEPAAPVGDAAQPAPPTEPAATATTGSGGAQAEALPRCSAEVRDRCVQDERFASDRYVPGRSRDNNAMRYRASREAERR